ncbi:2-methylcitrate synthase/citrate synthase II [Candidatus Magnetoovum chiemensis]|nr:2-methylcitrate synthase/citrate synthase II [Candidatus Magnetoovum chiemensis]
MFLNKTMRLIMSFPIEQMNTMAGLRLGTNLMRQEFTYLDTESGRPSTDDAISSDEDSIPMETKPMGYAHAVYEIRKKERENQEEQSKLSYKGNDLEACYHLIAGVASITAAISRVRHGRMPLEPKRKISHAANLLYMITGKEPTPIEERIMDICLILHADHGMNASTFAAMVVASTLSDFYFSVGAGIGALNGPLHGGANEQVIRTLFEIGSEDNVKPWLEDARQNNKKISGFGHRVYKAYDPRARILAPLAKHLVEGRKEVSRLYRTAVALEKEVLDTFGIEKKIFPNVDFYSGIVYTCLGIAPSIFTPLFAVSRVAGWTARVFEYVQNNRIFRPRAIYVGEFNKQYKPIDEDR